MTTRVDPTLSDQNPKTVLPWLVLAVSVGCTLFAWHSLRQAIAAKAKVEFEARVDHDLHQIEHRMLAHEQVLRIGARLFSGTQAITRIDWETYVEGLKLDQYYPGVQAIGYAPLLTTAELAEQIAGMRAEGYSRYLVRPQGSRDAYAPIRYVAPRSPDNDNTLGYDLLSDPILRSAMERARDNAEPILSAKILSAQGVRQTNTQPGALLFMPVYRAEPRADSSEGRRASIRGYVYAAFSMTAFMSSVFGRDFADVDVEVFDGPGIRPDSLLFDGNGVLHAFARGYFTPFRTERKTKVSGHPWTVVFNARSDYLSSAYGIKPSVALAGGSAISLLLFALSWVQANTRARAQELAQIMTRARYESEARLGAVIRGAAEAIITTDERQTIVMFNPAAEAIFRCPAKEAIGSRLDRFIPERFRDLHRMHIEGYGETGVSTRSMGAALNLYGLRADGEEFPIDASISQVCQDGQKFFTVLLRDITRRKQAQQAILEANRFNQEIMTSVNEGIIVYDRDLRVMVWNPFMETLTGLKREDVAGRSVYEIFPRLRDYPVHDDALKRALTGESLVASEPIGRYRGTAEFLPPGSHRESFNDPSIAWTVTTWAPHRNQQQEIVGTIVTVLDVTQLKRSQDLLTQSNEKLRQLSAHLESAREAERTRIAREIHDELAGTLTGIKMDLSATSDLTKEVPAVQQKLFKSMQLVDNAVQTTRRIINDLRPSILDNLGVWAAIEWLVQDVAKRADLQCEIDNEESVTDVELSPAKATALFRIVQESVTNVTRHAKATKVKVHSHLDGDRVTVEIIDDGSGFSEADLTKRGHWGVIGMHERAKSHGGELVLTSTPGAGTTVRVHIPIGE
jgi:PAS domain S-box-containing protein